MGTIYPTIRGTRWDRIGYDSYDLDANIKPVFMDLFRWTVRAGRQHTVVCAKTIDAAKIVACGKREWNLSDITEVRAVRV